MSGFTQQECRSVQVFAYSSSFFLLLYCIPYSFYPWWTFGLFLVFSFYVKSCWEHSYIRFGAMCMIFIWLIIQSSEIPGLYSICLSSTFIFSARFPKLYQFTLKSAKYEGLVVWHVCQHLILSIFLIYSYSGGYIVISCGFNFNFPD